MAVDGALDVARRDAYGSILNLCELEAPLVRARRLTASAAWHSSYYSQVSVIDEGLPPAFGDKSLTFRIHYHFVNTPTSVFHSSVPTLKAPIVTTLKCSTTTSR